MHESEGEVLYGLYRAKSEAAYAHTSRNEGDGRLNLFNVITRHPEWNDESAGGNPSYAVGRRPRHADDMMMDACLARHLWFHYRPSRTRFASSTCYFPTHPVWHLLTDFQVSSVHVAATGAIPSSAAYARLSYILFRRSLVQQPYPRSWRT